MQLLEQRVQAGVAVARRGAPSRSSTVRGPGGRGQRGRRPRRAERPARRPRPGDRAAARGAPRRAGREDRGGQGRARSELVAEAEKLAEGNDWRNGANRLRDLLDEWKALPRIDRAVRRRAVAAGSRARARRTPGAARRTSPSRTRSARAPRVVKERLVKEAEALAGSTDWGPTVGAYRDLMRQWKAAGPAPRDVEDAAVAALPRRPGHLLRGPRRGRRRAGPEFAANAEVKEKLLVEAEALLPVTDLERRQARLPRPLRALGRRRQGAARPDEGRSRAGSARSSRRSAALEDDQWRAATRRSPPAPTTWSPSSSAPSPRSRPTWRRPAPPGREEGHGPRGEPRLPPVVPRDGPARLGRLLLSGAASRG